MKSFVCVSSFVIRKTTVDFCYPITKAATTKICLYLVDGKGWQLFWITCWGKDHTVK